MLMIRSIIIVEGNKLDLTEDISTDFTYSIQDIRQPDKRSTDFSKNITLPGTARNNLLFAHIFSMNTENDWTPDQPNIGYNFNPNKIARALVLVDGIEVFRGGIQITSIQVSPGGDITYNANVIGRLSDILFSMGDQKLGDLDFSDMSNSDEHPHLLSPQHLEDVWNNPQNYRYTYPLIDYGYSLDGVKYPIQNFAPAIYLKEYIDRMFAAAGFTYNCPFFSTPYFNSLIVPTTTKFSFTAPGKTVNYMELHDTVIDYENNRSFNNWREVGVPFLIEVVDKKNWHVTTDYRIRITQPIECSFQFSLNFRYDNKKGKGAELFVIKNNDQQSRMVVDPIPANRQYVKNIEIPKQQWLPGDELFCSVNMPTKGRVHFQGNDKWFAPSPTDDSAYPLEVGIPVDMSQMVSKDIAQKDFFKSVLLMHNLFVLTDPNNDRNLIITPQAWFYSNYAGDAVDWTEKLSRSDTQQITPMGELSDGEYLLTYKKDADYYNDQKYFKVYNEVYGQQRIIADNDFKKSTNSVELIFSPTPPVQIVGSTRVIPHIYKVDESLVKSPDAFNIRILCYGGLKPSKASYAASANWAPWTLTDYYNTPIATYNYYPYSGMWDDPDARSRDLCFAPPKETFYTNPDGIYPDVGLYRYWWKSFLDEITNKDSKLLQAMFRLSPADIGRLDFTRLVKVDNLYYKLNKIMNYKPLTTELTKVELFKTAVQVSVDRPGFFKWSDEGYFLHSDESPARIPLA